MVIPASKVKSLCTQSEIQLVRASRKPVLEQHNAEELKRLAALARKQFDKWQGMGRGQSRQKQRATGASGVDKSTQLKAQIFRDALDSLEARLAEVAKSGGVKSGSAKAPGSKAVSKKTKRVRAVGHRADRAEVRKEISAVEDRLNTERRKNKARAALAIKKALPKPAVPAKAARPAKVLAATKATAPKAAQAIPVTSPAIKSKKEARPVTPPAKGLLAIPAQQREVVAAAKKSRVVRSGKTTRMLGHLQGRQKRSQARRDSKG